MLALITCLVRLSIAFPIPKILEWRPTVKVVKSMLRFVLRGPRSPPRRGPGPGDNCKCTYLGGTTA